MMKTNAMRQLDRAHIPYEVLEYDIPKEEFNGVSVAALIGMDASSCYKTLALRNRQDIYICVVPVDREIDLKKCAREIGVKDLEMVHVKELLKLVGYERGSVSPVGVKKNRGIFFDEEVLKHEVIEISGGYYGIGLKLKRDDILGYLNAEIKDICM